MITSKIKITKWNHAIHFKVEDKFYFIHVNEENMICLYEKNKGKKKLLTYTLFYPFSKSFSMSFTNPKLFNKINNSEAKQAFLRNIIKDFGFGEYIDGYYGGLPITVPDSIKESIRLSEYHTQQHAIHSKTVIEYLESQGIDTESEILESVIADALDYALYGADDFIKLLEKGELT